MLLDLDELEEASAQGCHLTNFGKLKKQKDRRIISE